MTRKSHKWTMIAVIVAQLYQIPAYATTRDKELIQAIARCDVAQVRIILSRGAHVNAIDTKSGATALIIAADAGCVPIVSLLLAKGANVNAKWSDGNDTALTQAAYNGHAKVVELLLAKGADINAVNDAGMTALMNASRNVHCDVVRILLARRANVRIKNFIGFTALKWANEEVRYYQKLTQLDRTKASRLNYERRQKECLTIMDLLKKAGAKE